DEGADASNTAQPESVGISDHAPLLDTGQLTASPDIISSFATFAQLVNDELVLSLPHAASTGNDVNFRGEPAPVQRLSSHRARPSSAARGALPTSALLC
ncbi:unnamed protein product, partial [Strongylus vulgaris]